MIKLGEFLFRYRNYVGPCAFVVALIFSRPRFPFGSPDLNVLFDLAGFVVAIAGQLLRILTIGREYIVRGGRNRQVYADDLVEGGMFALSRNPLYLGNLLIAVGLSFVIHAPAFYLIVIPATLIAYSAIVAAEEAFLHRKFGPRYETYVQRVPRWWPRLSGYREAMSGTRFNWRRVVAKEYNTTFILAAALIALHFWSNYTVLGAGALPSQYWVIGGVVLWSALYLTVRAMKKRGYLRD